MLDKEQLEKYLSLCMSSAADFAEIFQETKTEQTVTIQILTLRLLSMA